jgi:hypothetical protein
MAPVAAQINRYLRGQQSPLAGHGQAFVSAGRAYGVDPYLLVAIAGAESSFGKQAQNFNPFGWGPHIPFQGWNQAIRTVARGLRKGYLDEGLTTVEQIQQKWAPSGAANDPTNLNSNWTGNVNRFLKELKGGTQLASPSPSTPALPSAPQLESGGLNFDALQQSALQSSMQIAAGEPVMPSDQTASLIQQLLAAPSASIPTVGVGALPAQNPAPRRNGPAGTLKPGGGWGGSYNIANTLANVAKGLGLTATSEKRDRKNTASGGVSDHWTGSKNSYAFDLSNGSAPTPQMDKAARQLIRMLGGSYDGKSELVRNFTVNGYRVQILYRTNVGGNHFNHIHVGVRRL